MMSHVLCDPLLENPIPDIEPYYLNAISLLILYKNLSKINFFSMLEKIFFSWARKLSAFCHGTYFRFLSFLMF